MAQTASGRRGKPRINNTEARGLRGDYTVGSADCSGWDVTAGLLSQLPLPTTTTADYIRNLTTVPPVSNYHSSLCQR